ncbi:hypothetical protein [Psychrobium sp. 1_MG-2023]|uniref:hypothetical protein n=1 Tax=Psychrobium sp. 1_MG-2023 TaxID=3062624 RepID=UPI000C34E3E8|nr:hypothetical protein [Psychrobium sp. 1_MG-2023]MDP2561990.1 hypothetical protein [Psychrobium sp. 1_MG-2023]PKF58628.1 hypothetical protein CW748_03065 [Alteromonadales bacterium alter-6D02]
MNKVFGLAGLILFSSANAGFATAGDVESKADIDGKRYTDVAAMSSSDFNRHLSFTVVYQPFNGLDQHTKKVTTSKQLAPSSLTTLLSIESSNEPAASLGDVKTYKTVTITDGLSYDHFWQYTLIEQKNAKRWLLTEQRSSALLKS